MNMHIFMNTFGKGSIEHPQTPTTIQEGSTTPLCTQNKTTHIICSTGT